MNFSEPGCGATTITTITTINSSTPLHFARSLFSSMASPTKISDFTRNLTAIRDAAYLLLLPQTCRAEVEFHQAETSRISNGPLGDAVLQASTLFFLNTFRHDAIDNDAATARTQNEDIYEATNRMLLDLAAEQERYMDNMTLLLADMKEKWKRDLIETGSWHHTALTLGKSGIASAQALSDLVGERRPITTAPPPPPPPPPPHDDGKYNYLSEIARYWRTWAGTTEAGMYEEVWSYVAGRALVQE